MNDLLTHFAAHSCLRRFKNGTRRFILGLKPVSFTGLTDDLTSHENFLLKYDPPYKRNTKNLYQIVAA